MLTVWRDGVQKAGGHPWIDDSWYLPPERIPGTDLWQLMCKSYAIGMADSQGALKSYEKWHRELRAACATHESAVKLASKGEELKKAAQEISQLLEEFGAMECLPGRCELCGAPVM
jgi:hypothetical protein